MSDLVLDLNVGDSIAAGDVTFTLREKSGRRAKVAISAPRDVLIERVATLDTRVKSVDTIEAEETLRALEEQRAARNINAPLESKVEPGYPFVPSRAYVDDAKKGKVPR